MYSELPLFYWESTFLLLSTKWSAVEILLVERCSVVQAMFVYDSNKASCGVQSGDSCDSSLLPAQSPFNSHSLYHSVAFALNQNLNTYRLLAYSNHNISTDISDDHFSFGYNVSVFSFVSKSEVKF